MKAWEEWRGNRWRGIEREKDQRIEGHRERKKREIERGNERENKQRNE